MRLILRIVNAILRIYAENNGFNLRNFVFFGEMKALFEAMKQRAAVVGRFLDPRRLVRQSARQPVRPKTIEQEV